MPLQSLTQIELRFLNLEFGIITAFFILNQFPVQFFRRKNPIIFNFSNKKTGKIARFFFMIIIVMLT